MLLRMLVLALALAAIGAAVVGGASLPVSLEERLVRTQAEDAFPAFARKAASEPVEVLAVLVDYTNDDVLLLQAQAALLAHPVIARKVLPLYGEQPEFKEILRRFGGAALLPIDYFLDNEVRALDFAHSMGGAVGTARDKLRRGWEALRGNEGDPSLEKQPEEAAPNPDSSIAAEAPPSSLTREQRGWYAVQFVRTEGHDFLGQFTLDKDGRTRWIQTERFLEALNSIFAGGVRTLETKYQVGEEIRVSDVGWAAVDALAVVGATFVLRAGKAAAHTAQAAKSASVGTRAGLYASRVALAARMGAKGWRYAKWPVAIATTVLLVRHPSLVADALGGLAEVLGFPRWLFQWLGGALVLFPVMLLGACVLRVVGRPVFRKR